MYKLLQQYKFWKDYGKKYMLFSLNFAQKEILFPTVKGNNSCKTANFRIKVRNVQMVFLAISTYLLTLPLCTGVSRARALSPAWNGSPAHTFSSCTIPPNKKCVYFLQSPYLFTIDRLFPSIVEMFRINFYRVSLDFSFRNTKLIVVYVIERITTPIRNVHSRWVLFRFSFK